MLVAGFLLLCSLDFSRASLSLESRLKEAPPDMQATLLLMRISNMHIRIQEEERKDLADSKAIQHFLGELDSSWTQLLDVQLDKFTNLEYGRPIFEAQKTVADIRSRYNIPNNDPISQVEALVRFRAKVSAFDALEAQLPGQWLQILESSKAGQIDALRMLEAMNDLSRVEPDTLSRVKVWATFVAAAESVAGYPVGTFDSPKGIEALVGAVELLNRIRLVPKVPDGRVNPMTSGIYGIQQAFAGMSGDLTEAQQAKLKAWRDEVNQIRPIRNALSDAVGVLQPKVCAQVSAHIQAAVAAGILTSEEGSKYADRLDRALVEASPFPQHPVDKTIRVRSLL